ncbi:MAG: hypothetical protein ACXVAY_11970, partial [Mucilaginibacter sp.]
ETIAPPCALLACALAFANPAANISYALPPHLACIVFPDFGRSFSADGGSYIVKVRLNKFAFYC